MLILFIWSWHYGVCRFRVGLWWQTTNADQCGVYVYVLASNMLHEGFNTRPTENKMLTVCCENVFPRIAGFHLRVSLMGGSVPVVLMVLFSFGGLIMI